MVHDNNKVVRLAIIFINIFGSNYSCENHRGKSGMRLIKSLKRGNGGNGDLLYTWISTRRKNLIPVKYANDIICGIWVFWFNHKQWLATQLSQLFDVHGSSVDQSPGDQSYCKSFASVTKITSDLCLVNRTFKNNFYSGRCLKQMYEIWNAFIQNMAFHIGQSIFLFL